VLVALREATRTVPIVFANVPIRLMNPQHIAHDRIKHMLTTALARVVPANMFVGVEASIQLARNVLVQPDITGSRGPSTMPIRNLCSTATGRHLAVD
jgi:hypothetical protein